MGICSICNGDTNQSISDIKALISIAVVTIERMNPGGRELGFKITGNKTVQLSDYCNSCDYIKIKKFIKENCLNEYKELIKNNL